MQNFNDLEKQYEHLQEKLPGGPDDDPIPGKPEWKKELEEMEHDECQNLNLHRP